MLQLLNSLPKDIKSNILSEYLEYDEIYSLKKYIKNLRFNPKRIKIYEILSIYGGFLTKIRYRDYMNLQNIIKEENWDANGIKTREVNYTLSHVIHLEFYDDGCRKTESKFDKQSMKLDGKQYYWHQNGNLKGKFLYKNGIQQGKSYMWHENGSIYIELNYIDGKLDGKQYSWHQNRKRMSTLDCRNGVMNKKECWDEQGNEGIYNCCC